MNIQEVLVYIAFALALIYAVRLVYRTIKSKKGCSSGCGKCGVDFSKIDDRIKS